MFIRSRHTLLVLLSAVLTACGGGNGSDNSRDDAVTVAFTDNGEPFTYQTTRAFAPQAMAVSELTPMEKQMFDALNAERLRGGSCYDPATGRTVQNAPTTALTLEKRIHAAATAHANAMVTQNFDGHLNTFDLLNRTPTRRMVNAGYKPVPPLEQSGSALFFEESLAYGFMTPSEVLDAWKRESFDHCMTIYVPLTYGAVAVQDGLPTSKYTRYWVLNVSGNMRVK